jgi:hypothetical protein
MHERNRFHLRTCAATGHDALSGPGRAEAGGPRHSLSPGRRRRSRLAVHRKCRHNLGFASESRGEKDSRPARRPLGPGHAHRPGRRAPPGGPTSRSGPGRPSPAGPRRSPGPASGPAPPGRRGRGRRRRAVSLRPTAPRRGAVSSLRTSSRAPAARMEVTRRRSVRTLACQGTRPTAAGSSGSPVAPGDGVAGRRPLRRHRASGFRRAEHTGGPAASEGLR